MTSTQDEFSLTKLTAGVPYGVGISFAQCLEDVRLWRLFRNRSPGVYVDAGAFDPVIDSVTKSFSMAGWSGINVEPISELAQALRSDRPNDTTFQYAAGPADGEIDLHVAILDESDPRHADAGARSTVLKTPAEQLRADGFMTEVRRVQVQSLDSMLNSLEVRSNGALQHALDEGGIQFLKVDVEGFEFDVLQGINLAKWRPEVVISEGSTSAVSDYMRRSGYQVVLDDGVNLWFVPAENDEQAALLARQINPVLDGLWVSERLLRLLAVQRSAHSLP